MTRLINVALVALALTACGNHSQKEPPPPLPFIHRIAIIPAANPRWYTFENASPPVGYPFQFWVNKIDSHSKAYKFNAAIDPAKGAVGDRVTDVVEQQLRSQGFEVQVLTDLARPPDAPDRLDEEKLASTVDADAIVHLWIEEIGMYSGRMSTRYIPRVNLGGKIWVKNHDDNLYSDVVYYGVDAKKGKSWAITSDEKYSWESFDQLMAHIDDVRDCYAIGMELAATKLADQISAAVPRAARLPSTSSAPN